MLARGMVAHPKAATVIAAPVSPTVQVLVASRDLDVGERLSPELVTWKEWPVDGLNSAYISKTAAGAPQGDTGAKVVHAVENKAGAVKAALLGDGAVDALTDSVVRVAFTTGEPIVVAKIVRPTDSGVMAVSLTPGMRAMTVPLTPETGAGGFIQPGDHVDVVQTRRLDGEGQNNAWAASTVMANVRVIAIDAVTKPDPKSPTTAGATATLEVTPPQAEAIILARAQGSLTLILRSYADASGPAVQGAMHRAAMEVPIVRVFRPGGAVEQVKVAR